MGRNWLFNELDMILASLGLILSLVLTIWLQLFLDRPVYTTFGVLSIIAFVAYLGIRKFTSNSFLTSIASMSGSNRLYFVLNVIFFLFFAYSIISIYLRSEIYVRPLEYFVSIAFMASVVAVEIFYQPPRRWCSSFTLFKIICLSLNVVFSQLLIFPSVLGIDPWAHQKLAVETANIGHVPEGFGYSRLPIFHLLTATTSIITTLDYKFATMLSISMPDIICGVLFIYFIGTFLFNKKVGLLGALFLGLANWNVNMSFWTIPNTLAAVFMPVIIFLLFKLKQKKPYQTTFLAAFFMVTLILTHTVTAVCMSLLLLTFWLGSRISGLIHHKIRRPVSFRILLFFVIVMFSWWTYASFPMETLINMIEWGFSLDFFITTRASHMPLKVVQYAANVPFFEQLFNNLGLFLFFTLSIVGLLYMVSKRFGNSYTFILALGSGLIALIATFAKIGGLGIIVERWWFFSQIMLALPLALSVFLFCWILKNSLARALFLVAMTFSLSFLMILSPTSNLDNSTFSPDTQVRFALTESELQAVDHVSEIWNGTIGVDGYYSELRMLGYSLQEINREIAYMQYSNCSDMFILIREEIVNNPFSLSYVYRLDYDPRDVLIAQHFSRVYDSGSVSGFIYLTGTNSSLSEY